nr:hypothetical protein GCM10020185_52310 [Pseudomonas brassicacearum subsp. brassicacearum]
MAPCDLPALIDQAVEIAGNDFDLAIGFDFKGQAITRQFDPNLGPVPGTANELEQVLLNLLKKTPPRRSINVRTTANRGASSCARG